MTLTKGPSLEPVLLADLKSSLSDVDPKDETLLGCLLTAARIVCEARTGLLFLPQDWTLSCACPEPGDAMALPLAPVRKVNAARIRCVGSGDVVFDVCRIDLEDCDGHRQRLLIGECGRLQQAQGSGVLEVDVTAGLAAEPHGLPDQLRQAVMGLAAHWYVSKEPVGFGDRAAPVPEAIAQLLAPFASGLASN